MLQKFFWKFGWAFFWQHYFAYCSFEYLNILHHKIDNYLSWQIEFVGKTNFVYEIPFRKQSLNLFSDETTKTNVNFQIVGILIPNYRKSLILSTQPNISVYAQNMVTRIVTNFVRMLLFVWIHKVILFLLSRFYRSMAVIGWVITNPIFSFL